MNINRAFDQAYGPNDNKNFMTPDVIIRKFINDNLAYELSSGTGIFQDTIYGVTIIKKENKLFVPDHDKSKCCFSRKEALHYIKELKK